MSIIDLSLHSKSLVEPKLIALGSNNASFNFTNLFLFRKKEKIKILQGQKSYITGNNYDEISFIFPLDGFDSIDQAEIDFMLKHAEMIFPVEEKFLKYFDDRYQKINKDEDNDYIYNIDTFINYSGNQLDSKRNQCNYFRDNFDYECIPIGIENLIDAKKILLNWANGEKKDVDENLEAFANFSSLPIRGMIVYVDKIPEAYIFGTSLNQDTFAVLSIKGNKAFKGIYPFIYQKFLSTLKHVKWVNLESDLGISQLKKSKESYHPSELLKKWRISNF
jgi:hypothetical protein